MVLAVDSIDVLESSARRFPKRDTLGTKEDLDNPDDVELHQRLDPDVRDCNDHVVFDGYWNKDRCRILRSLLTPIRCSPPSGSLGSRV